MSPSWLLDNSSERSLVLSDRKYHSSLEGLSDSKMHKKLHKWFWSDAVDYGGFSQLVQGSFVGPAMLVMIRGENWMGRYANPDFDSADSALEDVGYGPYDPVIEIFERMSQEAAYHFVNPTSPPLKVAEVFDEDIKGRNLWLELLYRLFPGESERWYYYPNFPFPLDPTESFFVTGLPCNVFLASARTIEMAIDRQPLEMLLPPSAPINPPSGKLFDPDYKKRPAYERDQLWLRWSEKEGMAPAAIRDRWNGMSDEERQTVSPRKWQRIESVGGLEGQRDLIEKGLRRAKTEQFSAGEN